MRVGVVGLGRMGGAIARALLRADVQVGGYDLDPVPRANARRDGLRVADDLAGAVEVADIVVTSLPTSAAVREVVGQLAELVPPGSTLLETSTCAPAFAHHAHASLAARGVRFIDCPVSGKPPHMTMIAGASDEDLAHVEPVLGRAVETLIPLGRLGAGYSVKLLQQYVKYARFLVGAEALAFARAQGFDVVETARALASGTGGRPGLATAEERFLGQEAAVATHAPTSTIAKDVELTGHMFEEAGFDSPSFAALAQFFASAAAHGMAGRPYPEVVDLLPGLRFGKGGPG